MSRTNLSLTIATLGIIVLVLAMIVFTPIMLIAGLNLLGFNIPLSITTWAGAALVIGALRSSVSTSSK